MVAAGIYLFTRDVPTYTHNPIRFSRKNRQAGVHLLGKPLPLARHAHRQNPAMPAVCGGRMRHRTQRPVGAGGVAPGMTRATDQVGGRPAEPHSLSAAEGVAVPATGLSAGAASLLAGLASAMSGLIAILFLSRADVAIGTKVDRCVEWLFMMGGPVTVAVWCGLVVRQVRLSIGRLASLCVLLAVLISAGQSAVALFTGRLMRYWREQGIGLSDLSSVYMVLTPVAVTIMALMISWGLIRALAGPAPALAGRTAGATNDVWAGVVALGFGLMVYLNWVDSRLPFTDWSDFFPSGWSSLVKVAVALIFGAGVALSLRFSLSHVPAFSWGLGAPWAAAMAAASLFGSSWVLTMLWGADLQWAHGLFGFVLAMVFCFVLCLLPQWLWRYWRGLGCLSLWQAG